MPQKTWSVVVLVITSLVLSWFLFQHRFESISPTAPSPGQAAAGWSIAQVCNGFTVTAPEHSAFVAIADFSPTGSNWQNPQTFNQGAGAAGTFSFTYTTSPPAGWVR